MDYDSMTLDELSAAAAEHQRALLEARSHIVPGMPSVERLDWEQVAAKHRAHLNVIQPLRAVHFLEAELMRSEFARRVANLTPEQYERLRQGVVTGTPPRETAVNDGAAVRR